MTTIAPFFLPLLALLLPLAAFSGWYIGRRSSERSRRVGVSELSSSYFRGLNYLLNEQPDKAIEVFLKLAEFNRDTVETHLALGNLFRRRGEVDRAIRVHQHLIARPNLSNEEKTVPCWSSARTTCARACSIAPKPCSPTWWRWMRMCHRRCAT